MNQYDTLTYGKFYHIYNRGNNGCDLFFETENYEYFLRLFDQHIAPVADTFAWVLMKNHFHFLVRIKTEDEIRLYLKGLEDLSGISGITVSPKPIHQYFSNFFNAYTKAINKRYGRHGSLFEKPFRRKIITNQEYIKRLLIYIHNNPVHHGFCSDPVEYPWSSYLSCISTDPTKLLRDELIQWFGNKENFQNHHLADF
ncbi:MAG: transposase, partial [Bacteroidales bacterium]